jgi:4-amino-4-deoxy-L-arabinose transferase-like glycosyltransferase
VPIDFASAAIAARSDISPARWRRPFWIWFDGVEAGWAIPLLLIGFVAVWMAYLVIAYLCGDLHSDVLETWTLGRSFEWGNSKHPPLMGWVARAWTSVFPLTNWSFQLLALTNAAIALWAVDLISRHFVRGDKRIIVLLLLMLTPIYQLHAQRFNANALLLPLWPIAIYCFLRSFETRRIGWAVAAGAAAALAMLGKYYSGVLIGSFVFAAICHPQRRVYFGSSAPWVSTLAGFAVLGPHLLWLANTGGMPLRYALAEHAGMAFNRALLEALAFVLGLALVLALPAATWALTARHRLKRFPQDFRAMNPGLLLLFFISVGTIVFPAVAAVALRTDMPSIWALQGLFLFSILIVCGASYSIERFYSVNLAVIAIGIAVVAAVVAAPIHAVYRNTHPLNEDRNFYRLAANELTRQWHAQSDTPLPAVGGGDALAFAMAFYSPDHPRYEHRLVCQGPEALPPAFFNRGWATLCSGEDAICISIMQRTAAPAARMVSSEFTLRSTLLGWPGASQRFVAVIVPPLAGATTAPPPASGAVEDLSIPDCRRVKPG